MPELAEMEPGNPVEGYLKCFMEQNHFFFNKDAIEQRDKWNDMPLKDLPVELRGYGGVALKRADYAARLQTPDWQMLIPLRRQGYSAIIPEVQQLRSLAWALRVRMRGEIADRRFDDATTTAKTLFALSRHLGEHPTLIGNLVGVAVASMALDPLGEMIGQPGCPNLYWALTDLPSPLVELRKGTQGERVALASEYSTVNERASMAQAQLQQAVQRAQALYSGLREAEKQQREVAVLLAKRANDGAGVAAARKRLTDRGLPAALVNQFPPLQVIFLDDKFVNEARHDAAAKAMSLPYWQAAPLLAAQVPAKDNTHRVPYAVSARAYLNVRRAQTRVEQRIARAALRRGFAALCGGA